MKDPNNHSFLKDERIEEETKSVSMAVVGIPFGLLILISGAILAFWKRDVIRYWTQCGQYRIAQDQTELKGPRDVD
jgi:hypothetical protein